jgi:iron complex outermembrane receptor protein
MLKVLLSSVGLMALASTAAAAQDAPAPAPAPAPAEQAGINDIIVTASRRAENVQRAALSIQALSNETLERANISKPEDLAAIAPGVAIGSAGAYSQAYIRGVGNFATNAFAEGTVAFNLDGVYISRSWAIRGAFYDLERVEVLKGPQGTLYGRNASGGAINIITAKPKLGEMGGFVEGQVGNYDLWQGTAALNLPLGELNRFAMPFCLFERSFLFVIGFPVTEDPALNEKLVAALREFIGIAAARGWAEYRTPVIFQDQVMGVYSYNNNALLRFHEAIKDAVDPNGILSPGRYGIWPKHLRGKAR